MSLVEPLALRTPPLTVTSPRPKARLFATMSGTLIVANSLAFGRGDVTVSGGVLKASGSTKDIYISGNYTQTGGEPDLRIGGTSAGQNDPLAMRGTPMGAKSLGFGRGDVTVSGGVLKASGSTKDIYISGNYTQTGGELDLRIGGTSAGQYDRLAIVGSATLGGRLSLTTVNNYSPVVGDKL